MKQNRELRKLEIITKQESLPLELPKTCPMVSIIILNKNGANLLPTLFKSILAHNEYPHYEIIIVDNNSTDSSKQIIDTYSTMLPIRVIKNDGNVSFSRGNNMAARVAKGEYLLLLNNDVEPTKGWLSEMMKCMLHSRHIGTVGSKLIFSDNPTNPSQLTIQHIGISFKRHKDRFIAYEMGRGLDPFDKSANTVVERAAVTAASLLVRKDLYLELGGLCENYVYGYEDVDFGLKVLSKGLKNIYCPTSLLFHHVSATRNKEKTMKHNQSNNSSLLMKQWYSFLNNKFVLDKIENARIYSEKPLKVAFVVTETGSHVTAGDYYTALELGIALKAFHWQFYFLPRKGNTSWYEVESDTDILISLIDKYDPSKIKSDNPALIKIAWMRSWFHRWIENPGFNYYDILLASSKIACEWTQQQTGRKPFLLQVGSNIARFTSGVFDPALSCDYCFSGNYWGVHRDIISNLNPERLPFKFHLYGNDWGKLGELRSYNKGFLAYDRLPNLYRSTKIVVDDATSVMKPYGAINCRVFDALASGALVLTNGKLGSEETFNGELPVYNNAEELESLLLAYLTDEKKRMAKVTKLQDMVIAQHSYQKRAVELKNILFHIFK